MDLPWNFAVHICKRYLKAIKDETSDSDIAQAIDSLLDETKSFPQFLYDIYSNAHPASLGNLTESELDYVFKCKETLDCFEFARLLGIFAPIKPDSVLDGLHKQLMAQTDQPKSDSRCMASFIQATYLSVLRYKWPSKSKIVKWIVNSIREFKLNGDLLSMHELEYLRDWSNYRMSMQELVLFLRSRMELEKHSVQYDSFQVMPFEFKINEWCVFDDNNAESLNSFHDLCAIALGRGFTAVYWMPKYVAQLDPSGHQVAQFVSNYLEQYASINANDLARLAYLASPYPNSTEAWTIIARPICERVQTLPRREREHVYFELTRKETGVMTSMPGEVPDEYQHALNSAEKLYNLEPADSPLRPYRKWALDYAKADLFREQQRAEEVAND